MSLIRTAVLLFVLLATARARADVSREPLPISDCTVNRKCSNAGLECVAGDRNCADTARQRELEVTCEVGSGAARRFVYCPTSTAPRDAKPVWILMFGAVAVAAIGGTILYFAIRKKPV